VGDPAVGLWHGTRRGVSRGGWLVPPVEHGEGQANAIEDYPDSDLFVFVTTEWEVAAFFARQAKGRGRPKVLAVAPTGPVHPDHATLGGEDAGMLRTRDWVRIIGVEVIPED
jgi:hypothetical protein